MNTQTHKGTRRQLSLYVPATLGHEIEAVRRLVDPVQSRLIPAHVTLCREEEIGEFSADELIHRLANIQRAPVTLRFGRPAAFHGHGILLECIGGESAFQQLREALLDSIDLGNQRPHITLAHPRNPRALGNSLENAMLLPERITITFPCVALIEQTGDGPWLVLRKFSLD